MSGPSVQPARGRARCGLTLRSRRGPTARRREAALFIILLAAPCCRARLCAGLRESRSPPRSTRAPLIRRAITQFDLLIAAAQIPVDRMQKSMTFVEPGRGTIATSDEWKPGRPSSTRTLKRSTKSRSAWDLTRRSELRFSAFPALAISSMVTTSTISRSRVAACRSCWLVTSTRH